MKRKTILSLEQALSLPYATQRFVQLGWRVIRLESPGRGDPNRYIGEDIGLKDRKTYYIPPNVGKEAITIDLKNPEGQQLLKKLIKELNVDVFMCNTLPKGYKQLGIDFETLCEANPDLIWCSISAMGPDYPDRAGYDPAIQAMAGYMYLTGELDGDPMLSGIPGIDLKAGDEAFTQVLLAMLEQTQGRGAKEINVSMVQCAVSWHVTTLPQLDLISDPSHLPTRSGNSHRSFIPTNCYPTNDGYVYLAIGNDGQWKKLTEIDGFEDLNTDAWKTNEGRRKDMKRLFDELRNKIKNYPTKEFIDICLKLNLAVAPVSTIAEVKEMEHIKRNLIKTVLPGGRIVELFPPSVNTEYLDANNKTLNFAPAMGEHTEDVLNEAGFSPEEINSFKQNGIV